MMWVWILGDEGPLGQRCCEIRGEEGVFLCDTPAVAACWAHPLQVIGFMLEYLIHGHPEKERFAKAPAVFVHPCTVQLMFMSESTTELSFVLEGLELARMEWIFMPLNDQIEDAAGGTHWALLVYHRASACTLLYDSMGQPSALLAKARHVAARLDEHLNVLDGRPPVRLDTARACVCICVCVCVCVCVCACACVCVCIYIYIYIYIYTSVCVCVCVY
jgi:hypothetical protein